MLEDGQDQPAYLHDYVQTLPAQGQKSIVIHGRTKPPTARPSSR